MVANNIRIVFMGTPDFAVEALHALLEVGADLVGVVTSPDKPAGRGKKLKSSAIKSFADSNLKCPVFQPEKLKDPEFLDALNKLKADMFIVVAFRMLPKEVWSIPTKGTINLHASLLPQYRGAAPINWSIINGEEKTGVTTFLINQEIDTGKILLQEQVVIKNHDTAGTLHDKLMNVGAKLIVKTVIKQMADDTEAVDQSAFNIPENELKKAPKIFKEDCKIQWNKKSNEVKDFIRGLSPYPGAYSLLKMDESTDIQIKIFMAGEIQARENTPPGTLQSDNKSSLFVETHDGLIEILEVQVQGKKRMAAGDFVRGFQGDLNTGCLK
ncbi:MAG: methionyl-tRNA formyltransferase [Bacteroidales bacterium]|jgi:methionyl-tRNA formyltransferase|nr:methionyl-tRNA formyltransferase [Bacteroidales bacterium]